MKICIIGGGINGLCCAWVLAQKGHHIDLYERDKLVSQTSQASSKLLHGGLRYLEHGSFRLVREALKERDAWLKRVPSLTNPIRLVLPIYTHSSRRRWIIKTGLFLYDHLAGSSDLPPSKWLSADTLKQRDPTLKTDGLIGGYEFSDGQMDDYELGLWVADKAKNTGCQLYEQTTVTKINKQGTVFFDDKNKQYDHIVNVAGPWVNQLLENSQLKSHYQIEAIKGSHLIVNKTCYQSYLFEVPNEKRIFFVLDWKGKTLIGTTEIKQSLNDEIKCSEEEKNYLLNAYNAYHHDPINNDDIYKSFAGLRPLVNTSTEDQLNPSQISREYAIEQTGKITTVFGGKWTTALALANKVVQQIPLNSNKRP